MSDVIVLSKEELDKRIKDCVAAEMKRVIGGYVTTVKIIFGLVFGVTSVVGITGAIAAAIIAVYQSWSFKDDVIAAAKQAAVASAVDLAKKEVAEEIHKQEYPRLLAERSFETASKAFSGAAEAKAAADKAAVALSQLEKQVDIAESKKDILTNTIAALQEKLQADMKTLEWYTMHKGEIVGQIAEFRTLIEEPENKAVLTSLEFPRLVAGLKTFYDPATKSITIDRIVATSIECDKLSSSTVTAKNCEVSSDIRIGGGTGILLANRDNQPILAFGYGGFISRTSNEPYARTVAVFRLDNSQNFVKP